MEKKQVKDIATKTTVTTKTRTLYVVSCTGPEQPCVEIFDTFDEAFECANTLFKMMKSDYGINFDEEPCRTIKTTNLVDKRFHDGLVTSEYVNLKLKQVAYYVSNKNGDMDSILCDGFTIDGTGETIDGHEVIYGAISMFDYAQSMICTTKTKRDKVVNKMLDNIKSHRFNPSIKATKNLNGDTWYEVFSEGSELHDSDSLVISFFTLL